MLGVISILYGALNALAMKDLKKMIAYSSVSHMGFVLLGFASFTVEGTSGAVMQMVSHGILSTMLFFLVGVIYNRVHDRFLPNFRGLAGHMPTYADRTRACRETVCQYVCISVVCDSLNKNQPHPT